MGSASEMDSMLGLEELFAPREPHDGLGFAEMARRYNFRKTSDWRRFFVHLLREDFARRGRPVRALDIGSGKALAKTGIRLGTCGPSGQRWMSCGALSLTRPSTLGTGC